MSAEARSSLALSTLLRQLETRLLEPATRQSSSALAQLLTEDFTEFGASGRIFTRSSILDELASESASTLSLSDFSIRHASADSALVTYRVTRVDPHGDTRASLRSSLWIYREARWQMLFHQGTPASA